MAMDNKPKVEKNDKIDSSRERFAGVIVAQV